MSNRAKAPRPNGLRTHKSGRRAGRGDYGPTALTGSESVTMAEGAVTTLDAGVNPWRTSHQCCVSFFSIYE